MNLVTWNMQGASHSMDNKWNTGVMNLFSAGAEICCLQECGSIPASANLINANFNGITNLFYYTWGTQRTLKHILFYPADINGNRCNLAIVSIFTPLNGGVVYPSIAPIWRPALGFQVNNKSFIFCIHAISPNGSDAENLLNAINNNFGINQWVAAGDYNQESMILTNPFVICPPNNNTFSTSNSVKKLDYCVKNFGITISGTVLSLILSDHYPVQFIY